MQTDFIVSEVNRIRMKYLETEPVLLAKAIGIVVKYQPMGLFTGCCKGFFVIHKRIKHITINADLPVSIQRIILMHEIAHAILHCKSGTCAAFQDFDVFDNTDQMEYEANIFVADYLMEDHVVLELLNEDISFFEAAKRLYVPPELLDFKFRLMKRRGFEMIEPPMIAPSDFLKKL